MHSLITFFILLIIGTSTLATREVPEDRGVRILSLQAGSVRGHIEIEVLRELSIFAFNDPTGRKLFNRFDLIAGSSAGGVIALALGSGYTLDHVEQLFYNFSTETFPNKLVNASTVYNTTDYVNVLKNGLGRDKIGADLNHNIFVTGVDISTEPWTTYLLPTYIPTTSSLVNGSINFLPDADVLPTYTMAQVTTMVPSFFEAPVVYGVKLYDGALLYANPSLLAIQESRRKWPGKRIDLVVSIGTGMTDLHENTTGLPPEIAAILNLPHQAYQAHIDTLIEVEAKYPRTIYHRFDVDEGSNPTPLDEQDLNKINELKNKTIQYMQTPSRVVAMKRIKCVLRNKKQRC